MTREELLDAALRDLIAAARQAGVNRDVIARAQAALGEPAANIEGENYIRDGLGLPRIASRGETAGWEQKKAGGVASANLGGAPPLSNERLATESGSPQPDGESDAGMLELRDGALWRCIETIEHGLIWKPVLTTEQAEVAIKSAVAARQLAEALAALRGLLACIGDEECGARLSFACERAESLLSQHGSGK